MIRGFTHEHLRARQRCDGDRPEHVVAEIVDAWARDLRNPGIIVEPVGESMDHDSEPVTVVRWVAVNITGVGESLEDAVRRRTR